MSTFVRSQIDQVKSETVTVDVDGNMKTHGIYQAQDPNPPVNMSFVVTFKKSERSGKITSTMYRGRGALPNASFPVIVFHTTDQTVIWHYTPDDEGKERRDADYNFLDHLFVKACPNLEQQNKSNVH